MSVCLNVSPGAIAPAKTTLERSYQIKYPILYNIPNCSKVFPNHLRTCSFIPRTCKFSDRLCQSTSMCHVMVLVQPRQLWSNLPRFIPQSGTTFPSVLKCSQTILGHVALFPGHAHFLTVFVCLPQCVTCAIAPAETTFQLSYQNNSQILYNIPICSKVFPNHLRAMYFYFQDMQIV